MAGPAEQHRLGVAEQAVHDPVPGGARVADLLGIDAGRGVVTVDGEQQHPQAEEWRSDAGRRPLQQPGPRRHLGQCPRTVLDQQRRDGPAVTPGAALRVRVVGGQRQRLGEARLHLLSLAALGVRSRLEDQRHRKGGQVEAARRLGARPAGGETLVGLELLDQAGGDLQVQRRDQRQRTDIDR